MKDLLIIFIILLSLLILISTFGGSITNAHPETLVATPPAPATAAPAPAAPAQPMPSAKASLSQMQSIEPFDNSKYFTSFA